jgi:hypothetical protein
MPKNRNLPTFDDYEKASEWLETHSTADLDSSEVQFEIASPLQLIIIDSLTELEETVIVEKELSQEIHKIAQKERISVQDLINKWIKEKLEESL